MIPKDLTGKRFGHLVAVEMLEKTDPRCRRSGTCHSRQWLCKCDCGKEYIGFANKLTNGNTKSCGCLKHEKRTFGAELTGKRFGNLTVMCKVAREFRPSYTRSWLCMCDCGEETYASTHQLISGTKKTCGIGCIYHNLIISKNIMKG